MLSALGVVVLLATASLAADRPGQLCIDAHCRDASLPTSVDRAAAARAFTWWREADRLLILGVIEPHTTTVAADDAFGKRIVRVTSRALDRWPAGVTLRVQNAAGTQWRVELSRRAVQSPLTIRLPQGKYAITIAAPRHQDRQVPVEVTAANEPPLDVVLMALPTVTGRIIDRKTGTPVAGAFVTSAEGKTIGVATGDGRFTFDASPDAWPDTIVVTAAGYAATPVTMPRTRTATTLPDVELGKGATLRISVERPSTAGDVQLRLYQRTLDHKADHPVATSTISGDRAGGVFSAVERGDYVVIASADDRGRQLGRKITLKEGEDQEIRMALDERLLRVRTERAGAALPGAEVTLNNWDGLWSATVKTGTDGEVSFPVWQLGRFSALVYADDLTSPHYERGTIADTATPAWTIHVSTRQITGTVVDKTTSTPVANANVALRARAGYTTTTKAGTDGRFQFTALPAGDFQVMAAADGYLAGSTTTQLDELDGQSDVTIRLEAASERSVIVRGANGLPLSGAAVIDFAGGVLTGLRYTDAEGRVSIPVREGERRDLYVVPRDGAFAIARLDAAARDDLLVRVPEGSAAIVVRAESLDHEPIPDVWVIIRFNGVPLPLEVLQAIARQQGAQPVSGLDGRLTFPHMPSGVYELWPVGSAREMQEAMAGLGPAAPVRFAAQPGMNTATLRFSPAK